MSGGDSAVPDYTPKKKMHPAVTATIVILSVVGGVGLLAFVTVCRSQIAGVVPPQVRNPTGATSMYVNHVRHQLSSICFCHSLLNTESK